MRYAFRFSAFVVAYLALFVVSVFAQSGNSGSIEGVVKDPSGGAIAKATVEINDVISGYTRTTTTGADGSFRFTNVPFNGYHMRVTADKFAAYVQDVKYARPYPRKWKPI